MSPLLRHLTGEPVPGRPWMIMCPFAGASGSAFAPLRECVDAGMAISLAVYPGRDHRMSESACHAIAPLARELAHDMAELPDALRSSLLLCGHSMGAQVAFEATLLLESMGLSIAGLVLSGCQAPHLIGRRLLSHLGDDAFLKELIDIGGCSPQLRESAELLALFMPLLRADFVATETYGRPLSDAQPRALTPTLLVHGSDDSEADATEVEAWRHWLAAEGVTRRIVGDHFYVTKRSRAFLRAVMDFYRQQIA